MRIIDGILNKITMYRLVVYVLIWFTCTSLLFSSFGTLSFSPVLMLSGLVTSLAVGFLIDTILKKVFHATANHESSLITSLIIFFIMAVPTRPKDFLAIGLATALALLSKYVITRRGAHIFNPAALGVFIVGISGIGFVSWWIATPVLSIPVLLGGLLILRKIRSFSLFIAFFIPASLLIVLQSIQPVQTFVTLLGSWPLLFFGTIMLTEPSTMPDKHKDRLLFALLVGLLFGAQFSFGIVSSSPQLALLIGCMFASIVALRRSIKLTLLLKTPLTPSTYSFVFQTNRPFTFLPGQHIDITLPHVALDSRGNRRTFTIVSQPAVNQLEIAVKIYNKGSAFKKSLLALEPGMQAFGSRIAGSFLLQHRTPIVFLAGGIGITPFIAMLRWLLEHDEKISVTLLHFISEPDEKLYSSLLKQAEISFLTAHILESKTPTSAVIKPYVSAHTLFYISGSPVMVESTRRVLKNMGVSSRNIRTDFFSGY
jgi:ferredoxin-NADP reductase